jgi:hypothetical protein
MAPRKKRSPLKKSPSKAAPEPEAAAGAVDKTGAMETDPSEFRLADIEENRDVLFQAVAAHVNTRLLETGFSCRTAPSCFV